MYSEFYDLRGSPFRLNPDHRFFFVAEPHEKAIAHLKYALNRNEGFVVITGEVGAGKTTLVNRVLSDLEESRYITGNIVTSFIEHGELVSLVAATFGIDTDGKNKASLLLAIRNFLEEERALERRPILFVDEVQNLPDSSLEELRMLSNFSLPGESLLQIFLVGQPEFRETLADEGMEQLRQRVVTSCHLGTLDLEDTRSYILHRLKLAGWSGDPEFSERSFELIQRLSGGVPRRINVICDRLLLHGFLEQRHRIGSSAVAAVARDMTDEGLLTAAGDVLNVEASPASGEEERVSEQRKEDPPKNDQAVAPEISEHDHDILAGDMTDDLHEDDTLLLEASQKVSASNTGTVAVKVLEEDLAPQDAVEPEQEGGHSEEAAAANPVEMPNAAEASTESDSEKDAAERSAESTAEEPHDFTELPAQAEVITLHRRPPAVARYALAAAVVLAVIALPEVSLLRQAADSSSESTEMSLQVETDRNTSDKPVPPGIIPVALTGSDDGKLREDTYLLPASNASDAGLMQDEAADGKTNHGGPELAKVTQLPVEEAGQGSQASGEPESLLKPDVSKLSEKAAGTTEDQFLIQLVALRSAEEAARFHAQFEENFENLLSSYDLGVREARIAGAPYFRVMTDVAGNREKMTEICTRIKEGGKDCILVLASGSQTERRN